MSCGTHTLVGKREANKPRKTAVITGKQSERVARGLGRGLGSASYSGLEGRGGEGRGGERQKTFQIKRTESTGTGLQRADWGRWRQTGVDWGQMGEERRQPPAHKGTRTFFSCFYFLFVSRQGFSV